MECMFMRKLLINLSCCITLVSMHAFAKDLPDQMLEIMKQPKYEHSNWGLFVKDAVTQTTYFEYNADKMFLPGSTSKIFSVAALYDAYGENYQFKTPVYALGTIDEGRLNGNLVLVAQGDLTMGGRQDDHMHILFTSMDHIYANMLPGAALTQQDPLSGLKQIAKQITEKGIKEINGDVLIDDRLFETIEKRGVVLSPIMINENMLDLLFNPGEIGQAAALTWRPEVEGYSVKNDVKTVAEGGSLDIQITADDSGRNITVKGSLPANQKDILRTFSIKDPSHFARAALIQVLRGEGITVNITDKAAQLPPKTVYQDKKPVALLESPMLFEYGKLILKVSHNTGANLIPLLLAAQKDKRTYDEGMLLLGQFLIEKVKLPTNSFVFADAAGGDENRITPAAMIKMLDFTKIETNKFGRFFNAMPILAVDGSLKDFGKTTKAARAVYAKPGTGVSFNLATGEYFLTTQGLAGYIIGKNVHLFEYVVFVNNASMPKIDDIFPIFEDFAQISSIIWENTLDLPKPDESMTNQETPKNNG